MPDCNHEFSGSISLAALLALAYRQSVRGDHRIHSRARWPIAPPEAHARQPFPGIPPRLPRESRSPSLPKLEAIPVREYGVVTAVATCRRDRQRRKIQGRDRGRVRGARRKPPPPAFPFGRPWNWRPLRPSRRRTLKGCALVARPSSISYHDFPVHQRSRRYLRAHPALRARIYQDRVVPPSPLADNVVMMHFLERTGDMANMVGLCMGDQGSHQPRTGHSRGQRLHLCRRHPGRRNGSRADCRTHPYRPRIVLAKIDTATRRSTEWPAIQSSTPFPPS